VERPFPAYAGDAPYIFVSYSHDDAATVYPELSRLKDAGLNIWYDEGISDGFSLNAAVSCQAHQRHKLERLCRYVARPPLALDRLSVTDEGKLRYALKHPYSNGTTHFLFEPLELIAKLAALVPRPRANYAPGWCQPSRARNTPKSLMPQISRSARLSPNRMIQRG
jgi:hypothetical protein